MTINITDSSILKDKGVDAEVARIAAKIDSLHGSCHVEFYDMNGERRARLHVEGWQFKVGVSRTPNWKISLDIIAPSGKTFWNRGDLIDKVATDGRPTMGMHDWDGWEVGSSPFTRVYSDRFGEI